MRSTPFPISLAEKTKHPMRVLADLLAVRASQQGVKTVRINDAELNVFAGLQADMLMPILTQYANNVLFNNSAMRYSSAWHDTMCLNRLADEGEEFSVEKLLSYQSELTALAFYNVQSEKALAKVETKIRPYAAIPFSVSILFMDLALEKSIQFSRNQDIIQGIEVQYDTLDLTPLNNLLLAMSPHEEPRIQAVTTDSQSQ